jgi:hypothetical protein
MEISKILRTGLEGVIKYIDEKFYILALNRPYNDRMHNNDCRINFFLTGENGCIQNGAFNPTERCHFILHVRM